MNYLEESYQEYYNVLTKAGIDLSDIIDINSPRVIIPPIEKINELNTLLDKGKYTDAVNEINNFIIIDDNNTTKSGKKIKINNNLKLDESSGIPVWLLTGVLTYDTRSLSRRNKKTIHGGDETKQPSSTMYWYHTTVFNKFLLTEIKYVYDSAIQLLVLVLKYFANDINSDEYNCAKDLLSGCIEFDILIIFYNPYIFNYDNLLDILNKEKFISQLSAYDEYINVISLYNIKEVNVQHENIRKDVSIYNDLVATLTDLINTNTLRIGSSSYNLFFNKYLFNKIKKYPMILYEVVEHRSLLINMITNNHSTTQLVELFLNCYHQFDNNYKSYTNSNILSDPNENIVIWFNLYTGLFATIKPINRINEKNPHIIQYSLNKVMESLF